tara:strand:- start:201 stop:392 length:192 start_codon:yes stop_codon:yes gene_type:complete
MRIRFGLESPNIPQTQRETGNKVGLSKARIAQIERKFLHKMRWVYHDLLPLVFVSDKTREDNL